MGADEERSRDDDLSAEDEASLPPGSSSRRPFHWPFREGEVSLFDIVVFVVTLAVIGGLVGWAMGWL